jgi:tetratricopeptide (TPR) repeat protein
MNRENILFSLVGIGFGLFFGFGFASWANMRAGVTLAGDSGRSQSELPSNGVADQRRLETAAQAAVKAARDNPSDYEAQMRAARASFQAERVDDVLEFLLRANTLQPDNLDPVIALGNVNQESGNYVAAEKWYTAALAKTPDDVNVRADLGTTFLLRNPPDNERALAEFRRALQLDPKHEPTLQLMVVALTRKGDKTEARAALAKLESVNPDNPTLPQLRSELDAGDAEGAGKNSAGGKS